jgi:hypothetical protein
MTTMFHVNRSDAKSIARALCRCKRAERMKDQLFCAACMSSYSKLWKRP